MSRRLRSRSAAIEAKRAFAWTTPAAHDCGPEDETDDEGGIDATACGSCGAELDHAGDDCQQCGEDN